MTIIYRCKFCNREMDIEDAIFNERCPYCDMVLNNNIVKGDEEDGEDN